MELVLRTLNLWSKVGHPTDLIEDRDWYYVRDYFRGLPEWPEE